MNYNRRYIETWKVKNTKLVAISEHIRFGFNERIIRNNKAYEPNVPYETGGDS